MQEHQKRIAIYSRKSKFTGKGESISNQIDRCRDHISAHYGASALARAIVYEDEGFSGKTLERPGFQAMMQAARARELSAVVVYRLDRVSRNIGDFSHLIEELSRLDVAFVSIKEQFDTNTPMGRAMMYIASVFSQLERETIAERIRDNMHELAKTGRWLGGVTPTGYTSESVKRITVDGRQKKSCQLKLLPEEAARVRLIYDLFLESGSLSSTEAALLKLGILTKNGKPFTRFSIKAILQNPVYLIADQRAYRYFLQNKADLFSDESAFDATHGILAYHRTDQTSGKATVYLPVSDWIVCVGGHPGIIPSDRWILTQARLARSGSRTKKPRGNEALLSGVLHCACGGRMYPKLTGRRDVGGKPRYTYVCKLKERSQKALCANSNPAGNELDEVVLLALDTLPEDKELFVSCLLQAKTSCLAEKKERDAFFSALRREHEQAEKKIASLVDALAGVENPAARQRISARIEQLHRQSEAIAARMAKSNCVEAQTPAPAASPATELDLSTFSSALSQCDILQRRDIVKEVLQQAVWDGRQVSLVFPETPGQVLDADREEALFTATAR